MHLAISKVFFVKREERKNEIKRHPTAKDGFCYHTG